MATSTNTWAKEPIAKVALKAANLAGYRTLQKEQKEAIVDFVSGRDVFVCLPTGYGKSLCFALLPAIFDVIRRVLKKSLVVVVSPLNSLMQDQVSSYCAKGISAICVGDSHMNKDTRKRIKGGEYQLIFTSPEALFTTTQWLDTLSSELFQSNLVGLIVDEAHCIKKW